MNQFCVFGRTFRDELNCEYELSSVYLSPFLFLYITCRSGSDQTMKCLLAALDDISKCRNTETMRTPLHEVALRTGESITD